MSQAERRLGRILSQLNSIDVSGSVQPMGCAAGDKKDSVTVVDNRTGQTIDVDIKHGTLNADDFWKLKLRMYDPGLKNTANATSKITFISGEKGLLRYRGYPIEQLAEQSNFLEVAFLLIHGYLPSKDQQDYFNGRIMRHTYIHEDLKAMMKSFRYDAHPMGMMVSAISAMSTFHPEANPALMGQDIYKDKELRNKQIHRIIGTITTIAAYAYRHRIGRPYVDPDVHWDGSRSYTENFLYMLDKLSDKKYKPHPVLTKALDVLFTLHADHELNCSTAAMRHLVSSGVDVYTAIAGSCAALYGPRHGGANEAVLRMLEKIGHKDNVPKFIDDVKNRKAKLMGFGHRVYKNYDPRATIVRKVANEVFEVLGKEPLIEIATALEKVALEDEYFIKRKLYPNVDFYSGVIYQAMGFPTDYFTVLFAIPRVVGWLSHWNEFLDDPENAIIRPRQVYLGADVRDYVPVEKRPAAKVDASIVSGESSGLRRRDAGSSE